MRGWRRREFEEESLPRGVAASYNEFSLPEGNSIAGGGLGLRIEEPTGAFQISLGEGRSLRAFLGKDGELKGPIYTFPPNDAATTGFTPAMATLVPFGNFLRVRFDVAAASTGGPIDLRYDILLRKIGD